MKAEALTIAPSLQSLRCDQNQRRLADANAWSLRGTPGQRAHDVAPVERGAGAERRQSIAQRGPTRSERGAEFENQAGLRGPW